MADKVRAGGRRLDAPALVAWLSFVLVPAGIYLGGTVSGAPTAATAAATVLAAGGLPAAGGRLRVVDRVDAARWLVVVAGGVVAGTMHAVGVSTPLAGIAAGLLVVALFDTAEYRRLHGEPTR